MKIPTRKGEHSSCPYSQTRELWRRNYDVSESHVRLSKSTTTNSIRDGEELPSPQYVCVFFGLSCNDCGLCMVLWSVRERRMAQYH